MSDRLSGSVIQFIILIIFFTLTQSVNQYKPPKCVDGCEEVLVCLILPVPWLQRVTSATASDQSHSTLTHATSTDAMSQPPLAAALPEDIDRGRCPPHSCRASHTPCQWQSASQPRSSVLRPGWRAALHWCLHPTLLSAFRHLLGNGGILCTGFYDDFYLKFGPSLWVVFVTVEEYIVLM